MNIYRNKQNQKLYIIDHLIRDIRYLNNNEFAGIYAIPFKWKGEQIVFKSRNISKCNEFVSGTFNLVAQA